MLPAGLAIRGALRPLDAAYIADSWQATLRLSAWAAVAGAMLGEDHRALVIGPLLAAGTWRVCCASDAPDFIAGWAVIAGDTLHYVCVRQKYQRSGIATALLDSLPPTRYYSFQTHGLPPSLTTGRIYRPYRMFSHGHQASIPHTKAAAPVAASAERSGESAKAVDGH